MTEAEVVELEGVQLAEGVPGREQMEGRVFATVRIEVPEGELFQVREHLSSSDQVVVPRLVPEG